MNAKDFRKKMSSYNQILKICRCKKNSHQNLKNSRVKSTRVGIHSTSIIKQNKTEKSFSLQFCGELL